VSVEQKPPAWLPHSIAAASLSAIPGADRGLSGSWAYLLGKLERAANVVQSDAATRNGVDFASGLRHLLVLLTAGVDEVLRFDPDPVLCVQRASTNDLITWGMECPDCRVSLEGEFELSPLAKLSPDDQAFVIAFLRHHGSIKKMETVFDISYPTVKNRLNAIAAALDKNFEAPTPNLYVLEQLASGEITIEEALEKLV